MTTLAAGDALAGPAALLIVLVLLIATVFLIRNMDKRLKRLPREFPPPVAKEPVTKEKAPPQS